MVVIMLWKINANEEIKMLAPVRDILSMAMLIFNTHLMQAINILLCFHLFLLYLRFLRLTAILSLCFNFLAASPKDSFSET
jgi:hypothetical protein